MNYLVLYVEILNRVCIVLHLNFMYSLQEALSIIKLVLFCACDKNWYDMKNVNSAWYSGHLLVLQGTET